MDFLKGEEMKIKYHGHSCFSVTSDNYTIVLDPYCGVNGFKDIDLQANEVICSHSHKDHSFVEGVSITKAFSPFDISKIESYHDDCNGQKRGLNNIIVLKAEGKTIVHLGDLGHVLNEEIINRIKHCDILMIPVGGYFTIDAKQAIEIIKSVEPKKVIPMHYRDNENGYDVLGTIDEFVNLYRKPCELIKGYEKEIIL